MAKIISPSMLSADFGHLERDTAMVERSLAEWIHIDVMDGVFVPNISFGFPVIRAIRRATTKFMDVHLMIVEPHRYFGRFREAGADLITFHYEAVSDVMKTIAAVRETGAKVGISIKPSTSVDVLIPYIKALDLVLVMSVEPGFGGQGFIDGSVDRVRALRKIIASHDADTLVEIDGGISSDNSAEIFAAGCDVLVAGSAIFTAIDPEREIEKMLNSSL